MWNEVTGLVPKFPADYAKTLVQRAWRDVRRQNLWSFLLYESNWTSPAILNAGTVTVTQGLSTITFNAAASAAINAVALMPPSPVTQRQFRVGIGTIYNIWGLNAANPSAVVLTLDRNYQEPSGAGIPYSIYQCYYPSPVQDFWCWMSVRDMINYNTLITTAKRAEIDQRDPQRTIYYIPTHVLPYETDLNPSSPTYRNLMFELWGQPQYVLTYQLYLLRKGMAFNADSDTLPPQIGEDCVIALASKYAYQWAEANKVDSRMTGSDYRFLVGQAEADYKRLFREYRMQDRSSVDNFATKLRRGWAWPQLCGWYSSIAGQASPGAPW
jgi:hypothetical protein